MSSLLYGALTRKREQANAQRSTGAEPPGMGTYVDALAALVPAEVLALHAVVISLSTKTDNGTTTITAGPQLAFWFWFLTLAAAALYAIGLQRIPTWWDFARMLIPALAFVGWSMLQPTTAFDGVAPTLDGDWRWTIGLALAAVLGVAAGLLGMKADKAPARAPAKEPVKAPES